MNNHLKNTWTLRAALITIFHNWPVIFACIIIGGLLGWGLSFLWSSYYRASSDIYVGLNPYRKFSDTYFEALVNPKYSNLDNYHYWQMSQLNSAITLDSYMEATLTSLRDTDAYWQSIDAPQLRAMLETEWRSSGTWSLIAKHSNPLHAQQAAKAWSDVVVVQVPQTVMAARDTFRIDQKLQVNETAILQATFRQQELATASKKLHEWQTSTQNIAPDSAIEPAQRWQLLATITRLADYSPAWMQTLDNQPAADAKAQAYLDWIAQTLPIMESEASALSQRLLSLDQEQLELATQYSQTSQKSLSFSPNIEVQRKEDRAAVKMRPSSTLILVGGIAGLLVGLLLPLALLTKAGNRP